MSEPQEDQNQRKSGVDASTLDTLRHYRDLLSQRHSDHTSGKLLLPAEQSLALRSNISRLSEMIEPGAHQMWPDYSSAEKAYMAQVAANKHREANDFGIAFLGPLAAPAVVAKGFGAPPEAVGHFLEIGMNLSAAAGLSRVGLRAVNERGIVEPVVPAEGNIAKETPDPVAVPAAAHDVAPAPTVAPEITATPASASNMLMQDIVTQVDYAKPALEWMRESQETGKYNVPKLSLLLEHYSGREGMRAAEEGSAQTIHDWYQRYSGKVVGEGLLGALEQTDRFTHDFIDAITSEGHVDSAKLLEVLEAMKQGVYATPADYAAMQFVRTAAEHNYTRQSVSDALSMARSAGIQDEKTLKIIETQTQLNADKSNPYRSQLDHEKQPPSPDQGPER